jgi:hypothetical protein
MRTSWIAVCTVGLALAASLTLPERLAQWKRVDMPFHPAGLSRKEIQMVDRLVEACRLLDDVYWRQSDFTGLALYKSTPDAALKRLLMIMGK